MKAMVPDTTKDIRSIIGFNFVGRFPRNVR